MITHYSAAELTTHIEAANGVCEKNGNRSELVVLRRAETFTLVYAQFDAGQLNAIAEAEYYALDGQAIPSHGDEVILIDHHDLTPGQREESVFVVCDQSRNLLFAVNAFIARTGFPL